MVRLVYIRGILVAGSGNRPNDDTKFLGIVYPSYFCYDLQHTSY